MEELNLHRLLSVIDDSGYLALPLLSSQGIFLIPVLIMLLLKAHLESLFSRSFLLYPYLSSHINFFLENFSMYTFQDFESVKILYVNANFVAQFLSGERVYL